MDERRKELRHRTLKGGSVAFDRGGGCDCMIRNLSETGALLEVENLTGMPERFTLFIRPENLKRRCAVAWQGGKRLGVHFVAQHAAVHRSQSGQSPSERDPMGTGSPQDCEKTNNISVYSAP